MKYRVTAVWNDGLDVSETHATWGAALRFIEEVLAIDSIAKCYVEKLFPDPFDKPEDWDGSEPLS